MKAPFQYFGGKRRVASIVWDALGDVSNYIEPFAGSIAVLLERPDSHTGRIETVNDVDCFIANFWRALAADPDAVAAHCDLPVNECDLHARHAWLVNTGVDRIEKLLGDPDFYDAKVAGWWVWGLCSWIGSGWCTGKGPHVLVDGKLVDCRQFPHLGNVGQGVRRKLPHLGNAGQGIVRQLPHVGSNGQGISLKSGIGVQQYLGELAARLRRVRVCCGDWARVVTDGAMHAGSTVGVFLDPPYLGAVRDKNLYRTDNHNITNAVRQWCLDRQDDRRIKIVLAGYSDEHDHLIPQTWRRHRYSAGNSYNTSASSKKLNSGNAANRHNEVLWFSPSCDVANVEQMELIGV